MVVLIVLWFFLSPLILSLAEEKLQAVEAQVSAMEEGKPPPRALPPISQPVPGRIAPSYTPPLEELLKAVSPIAHKLTDKTALDLFQCFQLAAARWNQLKIDYQGMIAQQAVVSQTLAQFYPQVSFLNEQSFQNSVGFAPTLGGIAFGVAPSTYFSLNSLSGTWTIFNSFQNVNRLNAARATAAYSAYHMERDYQLLYANLASAFYSALMYEGSIAILNDQIDILQALVNELEYRQKIGRSRPADVFQTQTNLAATVAQRENYKGFYNQFLALLTYYLGIPPEKINIKDTQSLPSTKNLEEYLAQVGSRPDVLAQVQLLRAQKAGLAVARGMLGPTISVNGFYLLTHDPPVPNVWNVNVITSMPIFNGGLYTSTIRQQEALVHQVQLQLEDLKRQADENVRISFALFNAAISQVVQLREETEVGALYYAAQRDDFQRGVAALLDVLVALNTYQTARLNLFQAEMGARMQLVNLFVAAGTVPRNPEGSAMPVQKIIKTQPAELQPIDPSQMLSR
ncbi:TolC family protein [Candidatus Methylacidiphilum fumarolicum]|nr:TolC family protein [Candidatus Methylacidiphilum fumarolicum]